MNKSMLIFNCQDNPPGEQKKEVDYEDVPPSRRDDGHRDCRSDRRDQRGHHPGLIERIIAP